jgi:hypothetical protein
MPRTKTTFSQRLRTLVPGLSARHRFGACRTGSSALGADDDKEDSDEIAYLDEQLFPLFMLTGDAEAAAAAAGEEWLSGRDLDRLRNECEEKLPQAVTNIYRFWVAQRSIRPSATSRPRSVAMSPALVAAARNSRDVAERRNAVGRKPRRGVPPQSPSRTSWPRKIRVAPACFGTT